MLFWEFLLLLSVGFDKSLAFWNGRMELFLLALYCFYFFSSQVFLAFMIFCSRRDEVFAGRSHQPQCARATFEASLFYSLSLPHLTISIYIIVCHHQS